MKRILVIGSVAFDTIATPHGAVKGILGGSATYFSISASYFRGVDIVATVGTDFSQRYCNLITSFGVDIKGLETKNGKTFRWEGSYLNDMNSAQTIKTELNVFENFFPHIPEAYRNDKFIFLANIDPDLQMFILRRVRKNAFIGCDSMNHWIKNKCSSLKKLMRKVHIVFLNDTESKMFSGENNILKAGKHILSLGPKFAVIKKGEHGAILFSKDFIFCAPAYLLERVCDPTGAGDTFAGGFMGYLAKQNRLGNNRIREALLYGTIMASFAVEDFGIKRFLTLKKKDMETRYKKFIEFNRIKL